ncbi:MAG: hypothetical protein JWP69_892 [Flaviaesturariibacter sp.]|nr:hypothetical protein [Flaviaesturariibacter sp.]
MSLDIAALQAEITRQQVIIALLVEKNQQLEQQLAYANSLLEATTSPSVANNHQNNIVEPGAMLNQLTSNIAPTHAMLNQSKSNIAHSGASPNETQVNTSSNDAMLNQSRINIAPNFSMPTRLHNGIALPVLGGFQLSSTHVKPAPQRFLNPALPEDRAELAKLAAAATVNGLYQVLRKYYKGRWTALHSMSRLLHHLLTEPKNTQRRLGRVLEFSDRGVYMLLQNCIKRGLLQKTGYQQYALTEKALEYVREAGEVDR